MEQNDWQTEAAASSLKKLLPRLTEMHELYIQDHAAQWALFRKRLTSHWEKLFRCLHELYGWKYDFFHTLERTLNILLTCWRNRSMELKQLDSKREKAPEWYLSEKTVGIVLYVDLFSRNLAGLKQHIPYFEKLGVNYIHLMPLFTAPRGENDGGYAVSDYRAVNPDLGTMNELSQLSRALREKGISLVLDFVFNHTSDEHIWALKAKEGDPVYMKYYHMFKDHRDVERYQAHLRDIFPTVRKGSFTWNGTVQKWIWTTFNSYQWDLNYSNPDVFLSMAEEMLFLANQGIEILRLDAVAFIWKQSGTNCENLPQAHNLIRAFNAIAGIAAPALLFKSEAIVHPDEVIRYIDPGECQLSYNPTLMALLWESLATRKVDLLVNAMRNRERIPPGCSWVNYIRCHDDIGWTFDDKDAWQTGINPQDHRNFLNDFYTGRFPGSFARGVPFQFNPDSGDLRISGTLSSLAGLEKAIEEEDSEMIELAVRRINMLRSIQVSIGGIPLLYAGDEYGMLNDYTFLSDPAKASDSRWIHRSKKRWEASDQIPDHETIEWRFFHEMVKLFKMRKSLPELRNGGMEIIDTGNPHLFGYLRKTKEKSLLIVSNFSEDRQVMTAQKLYQAGIRLDGVDIFTEETVPAAEDLSLDGYRYIWILNRSHQTG